MGSALGPSFDTSRTAFVEPQLIMYVSSFTTSETDFTTLTESLPEPPIKTGG